VGPTQSGKTSGLAVPAILEWSGGVVAASVKTDLVRQTLAWRTRSGPVAVYDPTASTDLPGASWSPLAASGTWEGARRMAGSLAEVARSSAGTMTDGDFWYATAAKLLAPLLFAAATSRRTMAEVVRWIDTQEVDEVFDALVAAGEPAAMQAARASWGRDDRQRSAVYTTAETVVEAFADFTVAASATPPVTIDPEMVLDKAGTLYLCAPSHDQRRLRPLFATVVKQVIEAAYDRVARVGTLLDPPLLVVLDEAANVAPLAELDVLASTAAGHGVQLVTVWQDLAQVHSRYGGRGGSVINNHRVKVFLSGIADTATLEHASTLIGDGETRAVSLTRDGYGSNSRTDSPVARRLVPGDALRRLPPGQAVVVSGHLPPVRVTLRPWQHDRALRIRAQPAPNGETPTVSRRWWRPRVVGTLRP
jgi:type IV secretion system protein VirD4